MGILDKQPVSFPPLILLMLSPSTQDAPGFLQCEAFCGLMLDIAFGLRVFCRLSFCDSFNAILTAYCSSYISV